jgi:hypothetical protein
MRENRVWWNFIWQELHQLFSFRVEEAHVDVFGVETMHSKAGSTSGRPRCRISRENVREEVAKRGFVRKRGQKKLVVRTSMGRF